MVKNNLFFGADASHYTVIEPKAPRVKFPVYIGKAGPVIPDVKVISDHSYIFDNK